jgi:hypothetical protein
LPNAQAGSINPHPMVSSLPIYVLNNLGPVMEENRRFDVLCTPLRVEEEFELRFPSGTQLLSVPTGLEVNTTGILFSSQYQADGATVRGKRLFERAATASGHICTTQEIAERRTAVEAIRKNLGKDSRMFAFPYGDFGADKAAMDSLIRRAGYDVAFLYGGGTFELGQTPSPLFLPRLAMGPGVNLDELVLELACV